jgi:hypothetical protein
MKLRKAVIACAVVFAAWQIEAQDKTGQPQTPAPAPGTSQNQPAGGNPPAAGGNNSSQQNQPQTPPASGGNAGSSGNNSQTQPQPQGSTGNNQQPNSSQPGGTPPRWRQWSFRIQ